MTSGYTPNGKLSTQKSVKAVRQEPREAGGKSMRTTTDQEAEGWVLGDQPVDQSYKKERTGEATKGGK